MVSWISFVVVLVSVLVSVSFYTLYERKIMSSVHIRQGPSLVGWWGLLQPMGDAVKLFSKEYGCPQKSNTAIFLVSPAMILLSSFMVWSVLPWLHTLFSFMYLMLIFLVTVAMGVYFHLGAGWASNCKYSMIGAFRCVAQSVSYEVSMAFLLMVVIFVVGSMDLYDFKDAQSDLWIMFLLIPVFMLWALTILAETNRSPFDFAEGESELVSGFNVEYGALGFAFLFMGEYGSMIFMSVLTVVLFIGSFSVSVLMGVKLWMLMHFIVWARVSFPRTRYDKLMGLNWLVILPVSLFFWGSFAGVVC